MRVLFPFQSILGLVLYVFTAIATYTMAKRRGIRNYGLAWVPFGRLWILGSLSDQYKYVTEEKTQRRRVLLLCLSIGMIVLTFAAFGTLIVRVISMALVNEAPAAEAILSLLSGVAFASFALIAISVWYMVYYFIVLYNIYTSCDPNNAVLFLVLSILFSVTTPFFLFACRNKDNGMPPRYAPPGEEWSPNPPTKEPWEN